MPWWKRLWCLLTGACRLPYRQEHDPLVRRYARMEAAVAREQWRPRDLIDPR
jgi:hypothetical protein